MFWGRGVWWGGLGVVVGMVSGLGGPGGLGAWGVPSVKGPAEFGGAALIFCALFDVKLIVKKRAGLPIHYPMSFIFNNRKNLYKTALGASAYFCSRGGVPLVISYMKKKLWAPGIDLSRFEGQF